MSGARTGRRHGEWARKAARLAPPVALSILAFVLVSGLTAALNRGGALRFIDLLFDADSGWFLRGFSDGSGTGTAWGPRSVVHPNPANLVSPIVRLAAHVAVLAGWGDPHETVWREHFAMMVAPLFLACESVFVYLAGRHLFRSTGAAMMLSVLNLTLLPTLVFGAIPESFALSGCGFAALLYLVSRTATAQPPSLLSWATVGIFLTGVTSTNIAPFAIGYVLTVKGGEGRWRSALVKTAGMCGAVAVLTMVIAVAIAGALGAIGDYEHRDLEQLAEVSAPRQMLREKQWLASAVNQAGMVVTRSLVTLPLALGHSVLPPLPTVEKLAGVPGSGGRSPLEASMRITFRDSRADWGTFATLVFLLGALAALVRAWPRPGLVYRVAGALLAFNWAFHSVFGIELFLYSKHWTVPLLFVLAAWLEEDWWRSRWIGLAAFGAVTLLAAARSASALGLIVSAVSSAAH